MNSISFYGHFYGVTRKLYAYKESIQRSWYSDYITRYMTETETQSWHRQELFSSPHHPN